jgi:hypothetical protein
MGSAEVVERKLATIPTVKLATGTFVTSNTDGTVSIDFGQGAVTCLSAGFFQPLPGIAVRCLITDDGTVMLGPSAAISAYGTVTATGATTVTVTTSAGSRQLPFLASYTPRTIGDIVEIDWADSGMVQGKVSAVPAASYAPVTAPPGAFTADFRATDSGTFYVPGGAYNTTDIWCTSTGNNRGAWFYGTTIADTIPDGATISRVQIYINEFYNQFPGSFALIGLHPLTTKSGSPTVTSAIAISAGSGWKDLPTAFGNALKTGASYGIGTGSSGSSGYHKFLNRVADADSGMLRIDWTV